MIDEELYELCLPILEDKELEEEDQVEKLEELLRKEASLSGAPLENSVLDVLWRHRNSNKSTSTFLPSYAAPARHTVIRRSSPAPWQIPRVSTPLASPSTGTSPAVPSFNLSRPGFPRTKSSTASPFTSPRPSPRLALAQPIPHSPSLHAYEFSDPSPAPDIYGDYGSENVDWLVNEDAVSTTSSAGGLSAAAPEWMPQPDMGPHDILRSVLGDRKSNDEIEEVLEMNGYDLGATMAALTEAEHVDPAMMHAMNNHLDATILVGKSMNMDQMRPMTPNQGRSPVVCKYWLATGQCLRADCRFSHDLTNHVCKYWLQGKCLAGDGCPFSHDPSAMMGAMTINDGSALITTPNQQQTFNLQESYESFPALQPGLADQWGSPYPRNFNNNFQGKHQFSPGMTQSQRNRNGAPAPGYQQTSRPHSRPTSRHREMPPSAPSVDDPEAFPTLASLNAKGGAKKHHGKRGGHGHGRDNKENTLSSLADVVRMTPSPVPGARKAGVKTNKASYGGRENSATAQAIPAPKHIPWLETGGRANQQYLKYRQEAIKHGSVRNKFLQSAAQAWNRNDARAAKALSLRGQAENEAMRKAHREAARHLYEERNAHIMNSDDMGEELYIDLHGLHPEEAVEYLERVLVAHGSAGTQVVYAITGTGHHSKNGKDKVGKAVRGWLNEWRYVFREFSVPGERGGYVGGVLGIDPASNALQPAEHRGDEGKVEVEHAQPVLTMGKIQLLRREDAEKVGS